MGKITGLEDIHQVPPKVRQMYEAVIQMLEEGADAESLRVSGITQRAGIGKGTAYEYFDSKDEIVACAIVCQLRWMFGWLAENLEKRKDFEEQLNFLLDVVEKKGQCKLGFLRFVHMMTSDSEFNRMVREKMTEEAFAPYLPKNIFGKILNQAKTGARLREDLPTDYMVHCIFSHLLSYMMSIATENCFHIGSAGLRPFIYQGILNELCERPM